MNALEERHEALGLRLRARRHEDAEAMLAPVDDAADEGRQRGVLAPRGACALHGAREIDVVARREVHRLAGHLEGAEASLGFAGDGDPVQRDGDASGDLARDGGLVDVEGLGEERRHGALLLGGVAGSARQLVAHGACDGGGIVQDDDGVVGDVREEWIEVVVVRREVALGAEEGAAVDDVVDEGAGLGGGPVDHLGELGNPAASPRGRTQVEDGLAHRGEPQLLHVGGVLLRRLVDGVEGLHAEHEVAVELHANRRIAGRRPHVEEGAADGEAPWVLHDGDTEVAGLGERAEERVAVELGVGEDAVLAAGELLARAHLAGAGGGGDDEDAPRLGMSQVVESGHAAHGGATVGVHVGVGGDLAGREEEDVARAGLLGVVGVAERTANEEADVLGGAAGHVEVCRDEDDAAARAGNGGGDGGATAAADAGDVDAAGTGKGLHAGRDVADADGGDALGGEERREGLQVFRGERGRRACEGVGGEAGVLVQGRGERRGARHEGGGPAAS